MLRRGGGSVAEYNHSTNNPSSTSLLKNRNLSTTQPNHPSSSSTVATSSTSTTMTSDTHPHTTHSSSLPYRRILLLLGVIGALLFLTDMNTSSLSSFSSSSSSFFRASNAYFSFSSSNIPKIHDYSSETGMIETIDEDRDPTDRWDIESHLNDPYGTASSLRCFRDEAYNFPQHLTCIFFNLYIVQGKLRYLLPKGHDGTDIVMPQLLLGVPKWSENPWKKIIPLPLLHEEFIYLLQNLPKNKKSNGGRRSLFSEENINNISFSASNNIRRQLSNDETLSKLIKNGGPIYETPALIYQRLNPDNIYHHVWDDMLPVYTLLTEVYPQRMFMKYGAPSDVKIIFTDGHKRDGQNDDAWDSISTFPMEMYGEFLRGGVTYGRALEETTDTNNPQSSTTSSSSSSSSAIPTASPRIIQNSHNELEDGPLMVRVVAAGSRGRCTHRRHCTVDIHPNEVKRFKYHILKYYNIVSVIPKTPPRHSNPTKPKAIIIARTGRRLFKNVNDVAEVARELGYEPQIIGPFINVPLQEQLRQIANASLAVFLHGAELGNAWLGLPEGSCASVIFPYYFTDTISWWIGDKLGINIAPYYDMPNNPSDKRLSKALNTFDDALWIYHLDITVVPWLYRTSLWCASYPDYDPPPLRREKFIDELYYSNENKEL